VAQQGSTSPTLGKRSDSDAPEEWPVKLRALADDNSSDNELDEMEAHAEGTCGGFSRCISKREQFRASHT
jgi:hypothetical protein